MKTKISNLITSLRKKAELSQSEVAASSGVSFRTYQRIEAGEMSPRIEIVFRILNCLNVDPTPIFLELFTSSQKADLTTREPSVHDLRGSLHPPTPEPQLVEPYEVEGVKRALSNDFEKGIAEMGYWEWNVTQNQFYWSAQMYAIYEMDVEDTFKHSSFINKINPADVSKIDAGISLLIKSDVTYENIHRVAAKGGEVKVRAIAKRFRDSKDNIIIFGIAERLK